MAYCGRVFDVASDALTLMSSLIDRLDYLGVGLLMIFLAPEFVLPFVGFQVGRGVLGFVGVLVAGTLGALIGQLAVYGAARAFGERRVRAFVRRRGRWLLLRETDLDRVFKVFSRFEVWALVVARFVPSLRTAVSLPAGSVALPLWRFTVFTLLGTALWNALLIGIGIVLGQNWRALAPYVRVYEWAIVGAALLLLGLGLWRRVRQSSGSAGQTGLPGR